MSSQLLRPRPDDHTQGPKGAPVVMIEYADFQCPYCGEAEKSLRKVKEVYGDELLFVFRHFPLTSLHEWAELAALSSEAAALQGKFWEMHDGLFARQGDLRPETVFDLAAELGLDLREFSKNLQGRSCRARVERDTRSAEALGLQGTPGLFVNDELFEGATNFASLSRAIAGQLQGEVA